MWRQHYLLFSLSLAVLVMTILCFFQWMQTDIWKGADLYQHHAAGQMVQEGNFELLYRDSHLLKRLDPEKHGRFTFNYVYNPLVARVASWFVGEKYFSFFLGWLVLSLIFLAGAIFILSRCVQDVRFLPFFVMGFPSTTFSLILAQNTPLGLLIVSTTGWLLKEGKMFAAGMALSCLFYKPTLLPFLFFIFLVMGWHRVNWGLIAGGTIWLALTIAAGGRENFLAWLNVVLGMAQGQGQSQNWTLNVTWVGFFKSFDIQARYFLMAIAPLVLVFAGGMIRLSKMEPMKAFFAAITVCLPFLPYALSYEILLTVPAFLLILANKQSAWNPVIALFWWFVALFSFHIYNAQWAIFAPFLTLIAFGVVWTLGWRANASPLCRLAK